MRRLVTIGLWMLVLAPVITCGWLVRNHVVDQRFLDDWVWAQDLIKWKQDKLTLHDIFEVHMEHRPAVARTLTLFTTAALKGDVRGQNALTFLWLSTAFASVCWLWMRRGGLTIREGWLPLLLVASVAFTPLQWQTLLWPVCHGTAMPLMFLMLSLVPAFKPWPWWTRCLAGTVCAILAMLSFASGFLVWILPLPVFLVCGRFQGNKERLWFAGVWFAIMAVTMLLYFQVKVQRHDTITIEKAWVHLPGSYDLTYDLHNEVAPQYAYGQGKENTMSHGMSYFFENPMLAFQFMATFSGALLARGWSVDLKIAALRTGWVLLAGLAAAALLFLRYRKDDPLRARVLPMLCLGAYTPATGLMVAMGRAFIGGTGTALNGRYSVHQTPLIVGLIGAWVFIARHWMMQRDPQTRTGLHPPLGWVLAGALAGVVGLGWLHGASMMREWQGARFRGAAAQYLSQVFANYNKFVASVAGNHRVAKNGAAALNELGLLRLGLAGNRKLSSFRVAGSEAVLDEQHGRFERFYKDDGGNWRVNGYTYLPGSSRPADAVLLAYRVPGGEWTLFGLTQASGVPYYLSRSMGKDMYAIIHGRDPWPTRVMCPWDPKIYIEESPPPDALITAWALDMKRRQIHRVTHPAHGRPGSADGATLEELALEDSHE